jgi:hypothetical protein
VHVLQQAISPFLQLTHYSTQRPSDIQQVSYDGVVGSLITFGIASKIEGNKSQSLTVSLQPGEVLRAESGAMMYMTAGVEMNTTSSVSAKFKRFLTGQNVFISCT